MLNTSNGPAAEQPRRNNLSRMLMSRQRADFGESRLRLETIIKLRWVAVIGQSVTVLGVHYGFGFPVPFTACLFVIGLSAALNIYLQLRFPRNHRLQSRWAAVMLGYDLLQISALLFITGGLQNPFSLLIVVPIAVSASTQPARITIMLVTLALVIVSLLTRIHWPLPWVPQELELPVLYIYGVWTALICCIVFTAFYAWRTARENRLMSEALKATEMRLAGEQRLAALDGMAAAAAHELGTPLSTITLVAKELEREMAEDNPLREDIMLLRSQAIRCRDILGRLRQSSTEPDRVYSQMTIGHLIEEVVESFRLFGKEIVVSLRPPPLKGYEHEPVFERNAGVIYALTNIVDNAVDFSRSIVEITADWDGEEIRLTIADDGEGFAPNVLGRLGEPYVTTREETQIVEGEAMGMGLGVFISKTLLERDGATLRFTNRRPPESGAVVMVVWKREKFAANHSN